jgi:hypothetical protein
MNNLYWQAYQQMTLNALGEYIRIGYNNCIEKRKGWPTLTVPTYCLASQNNLVGDNICRILSVN